MTHAAATLACGPADGPATAIFLARDSIEVLEPAYPYVRVMIWQPLAHLSGGSWRIVNSDTAAAALYISAPNQFEAASGGGVTVHRVGADFTIEGELDLWFPSRRVAGEFRAAWVSRAVVCG